jgi:hypothetical protein
MATTARGQSAPWLHPLLDGCHPLLAMVTRNLLFGGLHLPTWAIRLGSSAVLNRLEASSKPRPMLPASSVSS